MQQYWNRVNDLSGFEHPSSSNFIRKKIEQFVLPNSHGNAFEIGCYPGTYLSIFGDMGYTLSGIDIYPKVALMKTTLQKSGYKTGIFFQSDFETFHPQQYYNVVSSFGYIEHYKNYKEIINKHITLLNDEGYIVIGAPNFSQGIQHWFHYLFDTPNLRRHELKSMNLQEWKNIIEEKEIEILYSGYCGGIQFWMNDDQSLIQRISGNIFLMLFSLIKKIFFWVNFENINHRLYSCYFLVVGRKNPEK